MLAYEQFPNCFLFLKRKKIIKGCKKIKTEGKSKTVTEKSIFYQDISNFEEYTANKLEKLDRGKAGDN